MIPDPSQQPMGGGMGMQPNLIVFKEPRGMIRVIQVVFAILAFSTTCSFDTESTLQVVCAPNPPDSKPYKSIVTYPMEYPFNMAEITINEKFNCSKNIPMISQTFPMDFSSSAQFYVANGVLSLLYSGGALGFYLMMSAVYSTNPLLPVIDLVGTGVFTIFWLAGSCAWGLAVSDMKHYSNPKYLQKHIYICRDKQADCSTETLGKWATLNISLIFGFANIFIWGMSMWFVFKETQFHSKVMPPMPMGGPPGAYAGAPGGYGDPAFPQQLQQQPPGMQQQQPFAGQY